MNNSKKLKQAFSEALKLDPAIELENLTYRSIKNWDSIAHMVLIVTIEQEFNIMISTEDVIDLSSFSKAKAMLKKYGVDFDA